MADEPINLTNQFLIAMPGMVDETFSGAVRKAMVTPGRIVVGSIEKVTPFVTTQVAGR